MPPRGRPARPGAEEIADKVVMVTASGKATFDELCTRYSWTQGRMFLELLRVFDAQPDPETPEQD